jgi:hypothetical protein
LGVGALVGLDGRTPIHIGPLTALGWSLLGLAGGALAIRRAVADDQGFGFLALLAVSVGLIAVITSLLVLIVIEPCGSSCL